MRRTLAALLAAAAVAGGWTAAFGANCSSAIVVFTRTEAQRTAGLGAVNPAAAACADPSVGNAIPFDTRVLTPTAADISIRYTRDLGPSVTSLTATVSGLGFSGASITLPRFTDPNTGLHSYASAFVPIPGGATASGSITVRIEHPAIGAAGYDAVCFRTWNASC